MSAVTAERSRRRSKNASIRACGLGAAVEALPEPAELARPARSRRRSARGRRRRGRSSRRTISASTSDSIVRSASLSRAGGPRCRAAGATRWPRRGSGRTPRRADGGVHEEEGHADGDLELVPVAGRRLQVEGEVAVGDGSVLAAAGAAAREQEPAAAARAHQVAGVGVRRRARARPGSARRTCRTAHLAAGVAACRRRRCRTSSGSSCRRRHGDADLAAVLHERQRVEVRACSRRGCVPRAAGRRPRRTHRSAAPGRRPWPCRGRSRKRARAAVGVELLPTRHTISLMPSISSGPTRPGARARRP